MLKVFRENLKQWKWVLLLVVASFIITIFAVWGGGGFQTSDEEAPSWAALVNGEAISIPEFINAARKVDEFYSRLYGDRYSDIRKSLNLGAQVMNELIEQKIILQEAQELGITATPEEISAKIMTHPAFMENGIFIGKERYTRLLNATNRSITEFENDVRKAIVMDKWRNLIADSIIVSNADIEREYREVNEKASFDYFIVNASSYENEITVNEDEAKAYFSSNSERFRKGETRRAKFIILSREDVKKDVLITDEDVVSAYQNNISNYEQPEQVAAQHILVKISPDASPAEDEKAREKAEGILKRIRSGESFEKLAKEFSEDEGSAPNGGDLGRFQRGMMVQEFEDAAFSLAVGEVSDLVKSQFGYHIIKTTEKIPPRLVPLEEVKSQIRTRLEFEKTQQMLESRIAKIRMEMKNAERFEEVAQANNLQVMDTGFITRDQRVPELGAALEFQKVLFSLQPFEIGGPVVVSRGQALLLYTEKQDAQIPPFEMVSEEVLSVLRNQKASERALKDARAALAETGRNFEAAARKLNLEIKSAKDISRRSIIPDVGRLPTLAEEILRSASNDVAGPFKIPKGSLVIKVTEITRFDSVQFQKEKDSFRENLLAEKQEMLIGSILQNIRSQKEVKVNTDLLRQI